MPRNPNTTCFVCREPIYRRPGDLAKRNNVFCSSFCWGLLQELPWVDCMECGTSFKLVHAKQKFCSKSCVAKQKRSTRGRRIPARNISQRNLQILHEAFNFSECMVEGCNYDRVFEIHRLIEGKNGGKYVIGNMFAICPNHHAEITRGLLIVKKKNNHVLRVVNSPPPAKALLAEKWAESSNLSLTV